MKGSFPAYLQRVRDLTDALLLRRLPELGWHADLTDSALYAMLGAGKAARPALVAWTCAQFRGDFSAVPAPALDFGLALEFIHTYSLLHDDLPCMDDDNFRRGRPTLHRLKGEAGAVLAGDALLTGAFELIAGADLGADARVVATRELARAAGGAGMVGGQVMDLALKGHAPSLEALELNHRLKTGALFGASCALGALAAGRSDVEGPRCWGVKLGLLFQVVDDLLDAGSETDLRGDEGPNYVSFAGVEGTRKIAKQLREELLMASREFGWLESYSNDLVDFFEHRKA